MNVAWHSSATATTCKRCQVTDQEAPVIVPSAPEDVCTRLHAHQLHAGQLQLRRELQASRGARVAVEVQLRARILQGTCHMPKFPPTCWAAARAARCPAHTQQVAAVKRLTSRPASGWRDLQLMHHVGPAMLQEQAWTGAPRS